MCPSCREDAHNQRNHSAATAMALRNPDKQLPGCPGPGISAGSRCFDSGMITPHPRAADPGTATFWPFPSAPAPGLLCVYCHAPYSGVWRSWRLLFHLLGGDCADVPDAPPHAGLP